MLIKTKNILIKRNMEILLTNVSSHETTGVCSFYNPELINVPSKDPTSKSKLNYKCPLKLLYPSRHTLFRPHDMTSGRWNRFYLCLFRFNILWLNMCTGFKYIFTLPDKTKNTRFSEVMSWSQLAVISFLFRFWRSRELFFGWDPINILKEH